MSTLFRIRRIRKVPATQAGWMAGCARRRLVVAKVGLEPEAVQLHVLVGERLLRSMLQMKYGQSDTPRRQWRMTGLYGPCPGDPGYARQHPGLDHHLQPNSVTGTAFLRH
jgi:hypothetical protein